MTNHHGCVMFLWMEHDMRCGDCRVHLDRDEKEWKLLQVLYADDAILISETRWSWVEWQVTLRMCRRRMLKLKARFIFFFFFMKGQLQKKN